MTSYEHAERTVRCPFSVAAECAAKHLRGFEQPTATPVQVPLVALGKRSNPTNARFVRLTGRLRNIAFAACAAAAALVPASVLAFTPVAAEGDALSAPPLVDMRGAAVDTIHGVTVVSFIYTRCPDPAMCPLVTSKFHRMAQLLDGTAIRLLEVTLDPAYDTPAVLRRYGAAVGADGRRWTLATGEPVALASFAQRMGLLVDRPRPGVVAHTEAVVIASDGIVSRTVGGNAWSAEEIVAEARAVATLPANPFARLALRAFGGLAALCGAAGVRGITPAATVAVFLIALAFASWYGFRMLRSLLAGP